MYYLAACDADGRCFGFVRSDRTVSTNPDAEVDKLMAFRRKKDANEIFMQINLSHMLLPNGSSYRVAIVRI